MRNELLEEINRFRLLSGYQNKSTLTENAENLLINEGIGTDLGRLFVKDAAASREAVKALEVGLKDSKLVGGGIRIEKAGKNVISKDADEIIAAVKDGRIAAEELGKVNVSLMKNTTNQTIKEAVAADIALSRTTIKRFARLSEQEVLNGLINKGWTQSEAELILRKYKEAGGKFGLTAKEAEELAVDIGRGRGKVEPAPGPKKTEPEPPPGPNKPEPPKPKVEPDPVVLKEKFKANWKKIFAWAIGIGGLSWLTWYLFFKDNSEIAQCLIECATKEELEALNTTGTKDAVIKKAVVGNTFADLNGGLVFGLDNGKVTTGNGQYEGEYKCKGNDIEVTFEKTSFNITGCKGPQNNDNRRRGGGNDDGNRPQFRDCSGRYTKGCKADAIRRVQECLGLSTDGKFTEALQQKLAQKGFSNGFSDSDINTICSTQTKTGFEDYMGVGGD